MNAAIKVLIAAGFLALTISGVSDAAETHQHSHAEGSKLTLDEGRKWPTDEALRTSMGRIRVAMDASLPDIHEGKLPRDKYRTLAGQLTNEVAYIVANCKLEPKADAQLHLVIADILAGAEAMEGKAKGVLPRAGAVKVLAALDNYAAYFEDAQFKPLAH